MADDIKILVVDDELAVVRSCEIILKAEGYDVGGALGGKEAMLKMEQNKYNLVLTDLKMADGITLIKWIRESRPDTGIVVITDYPSQESIKEALKLGVIDYMPKPFAPAVLIDVIHRALEWMRGKTYVEEKPKEEFPPSMLAEVDRIINQYKKKPGCSIPVLQHVQEEVVGYLPPEIQRRISRGLNIPIAEIHSIVSFYAFFTMKPRGKHPIRVCLGTACYVKGIEPVINKLKEVLKIDIGGITDDRIFSLDSVRCLGACGLAPVMVIDKDTYGALTPKRAMEVINQYAPAGIKEEAEAIEEKEG